MREKIRQERLARLIEACRRLSPSEVYGSKHEFELATAERAVAIENCFPHITVEAVARAIVRAEHVVSARLAGCKRWKTLYASTIEALSTQWNKAMGIEEQRHQYAVEQAKQQKLEKAAADQMQDSVQLASTPAIVVEALQQPTAEDMHVELSDPKAPGIFKKMLGFMKMM